MRFLRRPRAGRQASAVELTPLIDVVFLLLIFFMVSTTFIQPSVLVVELPEAAGGVHESAPEDIEVRVSAAGEYAVNGRLLPETAVEALVAELGGGAAERPRLVIAADARAPHEAVVRVLDAAARQRIDNVRIVTRHESAPPDGSAP